MDVMDKIWWKMIDIFIHGEKYSYIFAMYAKYFGKY
jgi:hypothetical protein